ncbi:ExeM/NucH family extracellular endonuclease [Kineococcus sp. SYSU DK005]|uniref:ExeM/NucH family extracellular endonuclease n=1 Tax=Kineococcus sp. SYSU DK005 TaxID=3383126 RepID=UPI003D7EF8CC
MPSRSRATRLTGGCVALGVAGAALTALGLPAAAAPTAPFISEIHYDNAGADTGEFVEVQVPAGTSTSGLSVIAYNGNGGASYGTRALPAATAPADAPAVAVVDFPGLQNGGPEPDGLALVRGTEVLEFLSYEGTFTATNGPAMGRTSTDIGVSEPESTPVGQSLSRTVAADGTLTWSGPAAATTGAVNAPTATPAPPAPPAPGKVVEIGAVQGTGATTPLAGQQVTVTGVVVGDTPGLSGFYLQDRDGDGDPATSDGVFVFSTAAVDLGDTVTVTGQAQEFGGQTQVRAAGVTVVAEGSAANLPAPTALDLPLAPVDRERYEGMRVAPTDRLTVSEVFDLTSFGELTLSEGGLLVQPTELARPGAGAQAIAAENDRRSILLDDAVSARVSVTTRPYLSPTTPVRVGDELTFTEPLVLGYGFDAWRLQPADGTADGVFAPQNTRPAAPETVGGDVQVGAFNVLNYFLTIGGVGRGATSQAELEQQAGKIVPAIGALGADVVTLMEIEDSDSTGLTPGNADTALADLVQRLNRAAGSEVWAYVPMPQELYAVDRDVIRNAIIYKKDVVQPVGAPVGLVDETVWSNAREPIAQTFVKDGDTFTVVANHFKSKGGTGTGDNADTGQGSFNGDRVRQAQSLARFLGELRTSTGDADVVALGDFNAYTQEDPIEVLRTTAGLTDLGARFDEGRYSYVFDALSGSLDHALASAELTAKVTDATHWNINSVESSVYQYTGDEALYAPNPYRSSDHDPVVFGLDLDERCQGLVPTIRGTEGNDVLKGTNGRDVVMGMGGNDVITGGNGDDVICGGAGDDVISGGNGDDVLLGGFGADRLSGENGADVLIGGPGTDVLDQGRGSGRLEQDGAES